MKPAATAKYGLSQTLIKAKSDLPTPLPFHLLFAGWLLACICSSAFYIGPILLVLPPFMCLYYPKVALTLFLINLVLVFYPIKPWRRFRTFFELFYDIFDVHHNMTPKFTQFLANENHLSILAMHPHAIIPLQAFIWSAFCDRFIPQFYGVGATSDQALRLPIVRHILLYLSVGSAHKDVILHSMQTDDHNLFILPGGVAEIFLSQRHSEKDGSASGPYIQSIKARRYGLMKLALQTGAAIFPMYAFGATDVFDQLMPVKKGSTVSKKSHNLSSLVDYLSEAMESISRRVHGGLTLYWGRYFLPIPHNPKLTLVMADPIYPVPGTTGWNENGTKKTCKKIPNPTPEQVEELMERYVDALHRLFEQYKVQAGYPNDILDIV